MDILEDIKLASGTMGSLKVRDMGSFHANSMATTGDLPGSPHDGCAMSVVTQKSRSGLMLALCIEVGRRCEIWCCNKTRPQFWVPGISVTCASSSSSGPCSIILRAFSPPSHLHKPPQTSTNLPRFSASTFLYSVYLTYGRKLGMLLIELQSP